MIKDQPQHVFICTTRLSLPSSTVHETCFLLHKLTSFSSHFTSAALLSTPSHNKQLMEEISYVPHKLEEEEEQEDALSLCDLPVRDLEPDSYTPHDHHLDYPISDEQDFEFSTQEPSSQVMASEDDIIVFGKTMSQKTEEDDLRDYLFPFSSSRLLNKKHRSMSLQVQPPRTAPRSPATESFRLQSGSSRKHKVLIGLPRIPPKMELSDIKKRQNRRPPVPMFSPVMDVDQEHAVVASKGGVIGRRHGWSLLRPLRCRANLARALTKAAWGCIPLV